MGRSKKVLDTVEEFTMDLDDNFQDKLEVTQEKEIKKEFGTVFLISKSGIFYDYNGKSRYKKGKFNVKVGDMIDV